MRHHFGIAGLLLQLAMAPYADAREPAGVTASQHRTYSAADFFSTVNVQLPAPGGLAFSADGRFLLTGSDRAGVPGLYRLSVADGRIDAIAVDTREAVRPLSLFPADGRILFASDRGGNELTHIFVREEDGSLRDLTPGDRVKADFLGWSADRTEFRLLSNARDPSAADLYAVDAATYATRLLLKADKYEIVDISPDGRWAVLKDRTGPADSNLYLADLSLGGAPRLITPHDGKALHGSLGFTPDSAALTIWSDADGEFAAAHRYDLIAGRMSGLLRGRWDISALQYSPSGRYRVAAFNEDGRTALTIFDTVKQRQVALPGLPAGDIAQVRFSPDERTVALSLSSDRSPADIYVASLAGGPVRRLTRSLGPTISEADLVESEIVRIRAVDGVEIPSLVYRPKTASPARPAPAIVWVHGGPDQSRKGWSATIQHLVNQGYAVIAPNFRGSLGYGKSFFHLDDRKHGEADLDDVVTAGNWMRRQDWVDGRRVAVMGRSYGGFLATAALAFRPAAFEAGIDIFGVTNWQRTLTSIPPWWESLRVALYEEMGDPATDGERHRAISPLFHADRIRRPLLVLQGANDPRVLKAESDELVAAVRANGTPVEYILFEDEGHGFKRRENLIRAQESYLAFLNKYLKD